MPGKDDSSRSRQPGGFEQPLALEPGAGDELTMRGVVLEATLAGHHEHHACDAALVRGIEQSARGAPGIVEVLEDVAAEERLEAPGIDAGQIRRIGVRGERLDGQAARTGVRDRVRV